MRVRVWRDRLRTEWTSRSVQPETWQGYGPPLARIQKKGAVATHRCEARNLFLLIHYVLLEKGGREREELLLGGLQLLVLLVVLQVRRRKRRWTVWLWRGELLTGRHREYSQNTATTPSWPTQRDAVQLSGRI